MDVKNALTQALDLAHFMFRMKCIKTCFQINRHNGALLNRETIPILHLRTAR